MIPKRDRGGGMRGGDALGKSVGARRLIWQIPPAHLCSASSIAVYLFISKIQEQKGEALFMADH